MLKKNLQDLPSRSHVVRVAGTITRSAIVADIAVFSAGGYAERDNSAVPGGGDFVPFAIRQRSLRLDGDGGDRGSGTTVREDHSAVYQLQHDEVRAAACLRRVVVQQQRVRFRSGKHDGDVVRVGVHRWECHIRQFVETEGGALAVPAVATLGTATSISVRATKSYFIFVYITNLLFIIYSCRSLVVVSFKIIYLKDQRTQVSLPHTGHRISKDSVDKSR